MERLKNLGSAASYYGKKALAVGAIGLGGYFLFAPSELDVVGAAGDALGSAGDLANSIWGHGTEYRSKANMDREAQAKYQKALSQASPTELFELRYTDFAHIRVARTAVHHSGIVGDFESDNAGWGNGEHYKIGDGCLNDTAFDINGGSLHFNVSYDGLFSSVEASATGDFPTAVAYAHYDPVSNRLIIKGDKAQADSLDFKIDGTHLIPQGQTTENMLTAYGCDPHIETTARRGY